MTWPFWLSGVLAVVCGVLARALALPAQVSWPRDAELIGLLVMCALLCLIFLTCGLAGLRG